MEGKLPEIFKAESISLESLLTEEMNLDSMLPEGARRERVKTYNIGADILSISDDKAFLTLSSYAADYACYGVSPSWLCEIDLDKKQVIWKRELSKDWLEVRPIVHNGSIFVYSDDDLRSIKASDGTLKWERKIKNVASIAPFDSFLALGCKGIDAAPYKMLILDQAKGDLIETLKSKGGYLTPQIESFDQRVVGVASDREHSHLIGVNRNGNWYIPFSGFEIPRIASTPDYTVAHLRSKHDSDNILLVVTPEGVILDLKPYCKPIGNIVWVGDVERTKTAKEGWCHHSKQDMYGSLLVAEDTQYHSATFALHPLDGHGLGELEDVWKKPISCSPHGQTYSLRKEGDQIIRRFNLNDCTLLELYDTRTGRMLAKHMSPESEHYSGEMFTSKDGDLYVWVYNGAKLTKLMTTENK